MSVLDNYTCEGQMSIFDLDIWSGKTYPEHLAVTKEKILEPSSKKRQKWSKGMPAFLDLRTENGHIPGASWEMDGALLGDYTMHSFGEYPKEENVSHLSQILEENPHPKYSLSAKACQGILRRAENRGKKLPLMLKNALERQSVSKNEQENPGGGKGILIQNERTGALSTLNNQSVCAFEPGAASRLGGYCWEDKAGTLRANAGDNQQAVVYGISSIEDDSTYCIQGNCIDRSDTAGCNGKGWREDASYTLNTIDRPAVAYRKKGHPQNAELVQSMETFHCTSEQDKVQTLKARDYKDPQIVAYGLDRAAYNQGQNAKFGFSIDKEIVGAQTAKGPGAVCTNYKADGAEGKGIAFATVGDHDGRPTDMTNLIQSESVGAVCQSVVRRLTPLECERLQGYPDGWTDIGEWYDSKGKKHKDADSPRYKALGNSIALPFWYYMASKMVLYLDNPTMASLFDGIGGFPLVFSRCGCEPIWASEIEEFPIAVTKIRFP